MRRRLIPMALAAIIAAAAVVAFVATRGGSANDAEASQFGTRTQEAGEVTVEATLRRVDEAGAAAAVVFDTHAVELDLDVAGGGVLTIGGTPWPTVAWDGDGPGGHHREGELRFAPGGPAQGEAVLTIAGLSEPVTFRWQVGP